MSVRQLAKLRDVAVDAVLEAFAPLALVERPEKDRVTLRLRAGALPCRDEALAFIQPGDVLRPVIRYNDRQGNPRRILPVPWTFCTVQRVAAERLHCRLESGLRSPLSGRRRGRVQRFALAVGTPRGPTVLTLQSQSEPAEGLEGYTIYSRGSNSDVPTLLGRTDRRGRITVPPAPGLVRVLLVQSGSEPLARLPIVPGLEPELTVRVPDDSERLEAEGVATGLQEQLLDLVARREVMLARAKAHLQARELAKAQTLIDALQGLPNQGDFRRTLASRKNSSYSDDPAVQAKIDKLFQRVENSIAKHLQPGPIESLRQQLRTAQGQAGS